MASEKAMRLATVIEGFCDVHPHESTDEIIKRSAAIIDQAIAEARLEGALAMQKRSIGLFLMPMGYDAPVLATHVQKVLLHLDPQQVINESMGK